MKSSLMEIQQEYKQNIKFALSSAVDKERELGVQICSAQRFRAGGQGRRWVSHGRGWISLWRRQLLGSWEQEGGGLGGSNMSKGFEL